MNPEAKGIFSEARQRLRELKAEGLAEGEARGLAKAVLKLLAHRGIAISDEQRKEISSCTDIDLLNRWNDLAFTVTSVNELFAAKI